MSRTFHHGTQGDYPEKNRVYAPTENRREKNEARLIKRVSGNTPLPSYHEVYTEILSDVRASSGYSLKIRGLIQSTLDDMFSGTLDITKLNDGDHRTYSAYTQRKVDQVLAYEPALTQQYLCNTDTDIPLLTYEPTPIRALEIKEKEILKTKLFAMLAALMPPREYTMIQDFIREILDTIRIKSIYIQNLIELIVNIAVAHINTKRKGTKKYI